MTIRYVCQCGAITDERRCSDCKRKPWANAKPRTTLSGSAQQARAKRVIARDGGHCHVCGLLGSDEADHVVPIAEGGADDENNMRAIHSECHKTKTQAEAQRGRRRRGRASSAPRQREHCTPFVILVGLSGVGKSEVRRILAEKLEATPLGPDDFADRWPGVYDRLDHAPRAVVECVRIPDALLHKAQQRHAVIVELTATKATRRERLQARGTPPTLIRKYLRETDEGLTYGKDVAPALRISTDGREPAEIAEQLAESLPTRVTPRGRSLVTVTTSRAG